MQTQNFVMILRLVQVRIKKKEIWYFFPKTFQIWTLKRELNTLDATIFNFKWKLKLESKTSSSGWKSL